MNLICLDRVDTLYFNVWNYFYYYYYQTSLLHKHVYTMKQEKREMKRQMQRFSLKTTSNLTQNDTGLKLESAPTVLKIPNRFIKWAFVFE